MLGLSNLTIAFGKLWYLLQSLEHQLVHLVVLVLDSETCQWIPLARGFVLLTGDSFLHHTRLTDFGLNLPLNE